MKKVVAVNLHQNVQVIFDFFVLANVMFSYCFSRDGNNEILTCRAFFRNACKPCCPSWLGNKEIDFPVGHCYRFWKFCAGGSWKSLGNRRCPAAISIPVLVLHRMKTVAVMAYIWSWIILVSGRSS